MVRWNLVVWLKADSWTLIGEMSEFMRPLSENRESFRLAKTGWWEEEVEVIACFDLLGHFSDPQSSFKDKHLCHSFLFKKGKIGVCSTFGNG